LDNADDDNGLLQTLYTFKSSCYTEIVIVSIRQHEVDLPSQYM